MIKKRLSKHDWLERSIDLLSQEGDAKLRISPLCKALGVTKGSFYAHFEDRADFVRQLLQFWADNYTEKIACAIDALKDKPAESRLLTLMLTIHREGAASQDIPFRAWATHDADVAKGVKEIDRRRFEFVRQLFHEIGFRGAELDLRTRLFVVYQSASAGVYLPESGLKAETEIKRRHAFLIRP